MGGARGDGSTSTIVVSRRSDVWKRVGNGESRLYRKVHVIST